MSKEGDALARWLNRKRKSQLGEAVSCFHDWHRRYVANEVTLDTVLGRSAGPFMVAFTLHVKKDSFHFTPETFTDAATWWLLQLARSQQLYRLRECGFCRQWYFARRDAQKFCSVNCRVKAHVRLETPEVRKRKRAEYMRGYREREKERKEQAERFKKQVRAESIIENERKLKRGKRQ